MANRINGKPRSLDSFGVSGALDEDAIVYYTTLFSTRQIGRVSDLISVRLNPNLKSELKIRTLLVLGTLQAYQAQFPLEENRLEIVRTNESTLEHPLLIEVGIDSEKVAISVCFDMKEDVVVNFKDLSERIYQKKPSDAFESLLVELYSQSDHFLLRFQESTRRTEIVTSILIRSQLEEPKEQGDQVLPQIVMLSQFVLSQAPKPKAYIDLGDLDFVALLREENSKAKDKKAPGKDSDEELLENSVEEIDDETIAESVEELTEEIDEEILISREKKEYADDNTITVVKGSSVKENSTDEVIKVSGKGEIENKGPGITNMMGISGSEGSSESEARKLILEIQSGRLDFIVKKTNPEQLPFRKDLKPETLKYIDGLVEDVRKAKEHLTETARKLSYSIRVRESSLKNEQEALQKELKRKDSSLVQKNQTILSLKQELVEANKMIDKLKRGKVPVVEDTGSDARVKSAETEKMFLQAREENKVLTQRYETIQSQLNAIQSSKSSALERVNEKLEATKVKINLFQKKDQEQKRIIARLAGELKAFKKKAEAEAEAEEAKSSKKDSGKKDSGKKAA